jgi:hypothetical protein
LTLQATLKVWISNYCEADFSRCARYQVACSSKPVPLALLPNGKMLAVMAPGKEGT